MRELYLDHAATTPVRDEVALAMEEARRGAFANPSSPHAAGRRAKAVLEDCRDQIRTLIGATGRHDRLVFTSGATEANRLAVLGMAAAIPGAGGTTGVAACSARDHTSCVAAVTELAARQGAQRWETVRAPLTPAGTLDPVWLRHWAAAAAARPHLLCMTLVCGQSGTVEPFAEPFAEDETLPWDPAAGSWERDLRVHVDATQAVGLFDVSFAQLASSAQLPAATLTLAPHKFGGPRGIGGLVVRSDIPLEPLAAGPQEQGLRGGTEPVVLAVGFARALDLAVAARRAEAERLTSLRDRLETGLMARAREVGVEAHVINGGGMGGTGPRRAPHISTLAFSVLNAGAESGRGIDRQALVMAADLEGVCIATGTACASGSSEPAPALAAMGLPKPVLESAVRISVGRDTTPAVIDEALARLGRVLARMATR